MPRIWGASIEDHHEMVWADLAEALRQLLLERDYDSINIGHIVTGQPPSSRVNNPAGQYNESTNSAGRFARYPEGAGCASPTGARGDHQPT